MKKRAKIVSSVERAERKPEAFRMKEKSWTQTPGDCRDYDFLHVSSPPWLFFTIIRISPEEGIFFNEIKKKKIKSETAAASCGAAELNGRLIHLACSTKIISCNFFPLFLCAHWKVSIPDGSAG